MVGRRQVSSWLASAASLPPMDISPPLILLYENGYNVLGTRNKDDDLRLPDPHVVGEQPDNGGGPVRSSGATQQTIHTERKENEDGTIGTPDPQTRDHRLVPRH